jgi:hypothetical protein
VPEIAAVVSGGVIYNQVHPVLGLSGLQESAAIAVDREYRRGRAAPAPRAVVAEHKEPEASGEAVGMLSGTRDYISDFADAAENAVDATEPKR